MATWKDSFKASAKVLAYSAAWWAVGGIMVAIGFGIMASTAFTYAQAGIAQKSIEPSVGKILFATLLILVGFIITILGFTASFFKVFAEFLRKEIKREEEKAAPQHAQKAIE